MGCGNCVIPVYGSKNREKVEALLYCMDSNDYQPNKLYGPYDWIHFDQIAWYREQSARFTKENNGSLCLHWLFSISLCLNTTR